MVLEVARLLVVEEQEAAFERAFDQFKGTLAPSPGFGGAELQRSIERPREYWLFVRWETVEAHTVDFRRAGGFARWDELVGPYLAAPAEAVHTDLRVRVEPGAATE
jgi:heme-degrading monooxygenase HmoA